MQRLFSTSVNEKQSSKLNERIEQMLNIKATERWKETHPGALIGLLEISGVDNTLPAPELEREKSKIEAALREHYQGFGRQDFFTIPAMAVYREYYKGFKKTYHVLQQVESIALKGKKLPKVSPLVDANFVAEVETLVLTAGHDVEKLKGKVYIDIAVEGDEIIQMNGAEKSLYPNDMVMKDDGGVCCTIIYGQDNRSPITKETSHALYVAYAPAGIPADLVKEHLRKIEKNIRLFSNTATLEKLTLLEG